MEGDGNGWVECTLGHRHWGRYGAAGLLLHTIDDAGVVRVLLQHRAEWSHHGGTWGMPGGARDSHEDAVAGALREALEETGLDAGRLRVRHTYVDDHGGWSYTTVYADTPRELPTELNRESVALEWVPLADVLGRCLHPGLAHSWASIAAHPVTVLVDAGNVVGSRPDGWWRDRAGATQRLLGRLDGLRGVVATSPAGPTVVVSRVVVVVEGRAREAADPGWAEVVRAAGSGDDAIVAEAARGAVNDVAAGGSPGGPQRVGLVVVTADRGLRARVQAAAPATELTGPSWLLSLL